jgi:hypothetical protein
VSLLMLLLIAAAAEFHACNAFEVDPYQSGLLVPRMYEPASAPPMLPLRIPPLYVPVSSQLSPGRLFILKEENKMVAKKHFTTEQAREIGDKLGIDWSRSNVEQFRMGLDVELEHGLNDPATDVTGNDPILTGKIALAHLNEFADYYTRLAKMEREAKKELSQS